MSNSDQFTAGLERPIPGSYDERLAEARRLYEHGAHEEALAILDRVTGRILRLPERRRLPDSELWVNLVAATALTAVIKSTLGQVAEAEALWMKLEEWDAEHRSNWQRLRFLHQIKRGETDEGLRQLRELAEQDPHNLDNWVTAASSALEAGRYDSAAECIERAEPLLEESEVEGAIAGFYLVRFSLNVKLERWREALDDWLAAMDFDDELEDYIELTLRELLAAEQFDLALELLEDELFISPVAEYYQAWIARRRGDLVRARHLWRQVLDAEEDDETELVQFKALSLCWLGRPIEAIAALLEEIELSGGIRAIDAAVLALGWGMTGNVAEARANLTTAVKLAKQGQLLSALEWYDFDALITDDQVKAALREYFDLDQPDAVKPASSSG